MTVAEIEHIGAPEISEAAARRAYRDYRHALRSTTDKRTQRDYAIAARSYRAIANGRTVIDLVAVMKATGLQPDTHYPRLAICPADAEWCWVSMRPEGSACFYAVEPRSRHWRVAQDLRVDLPNDTYQHYAWSDRPSRWSNEAKALVPMIPPGLKPAGNLRLFHILWDAVWQPEPPKDPLLLKHLGGPMYAVLAAWDLTPIERAVMRGRL